MKLFLLRHGAAQARIDGVDDPKRALIPKGQKQIAVVAKLLRRINVRFDAVISSPYQRALESAHALCSSMKLKNTAIKVDNRLNAEAGVPDAISVLKDLDSEVVLMVGHEPTLSRLAAHLLGFEDGWFNLKKGGLIELRLISRAPLRAELYGWIRPAHLKS
jgi:phosphohistidine phosphatase